MFSVCGGGGARTVKKVLESSNRKKLPTQNSSQAVMIRILCCDSKINVIHQGTKEVLHDHFSRHTEAFKKIQHPFLIFKTTSELERERNFSSLIKGISDRHS